MLLTDAVEFHLPDAEERGQRIESRIAPGLVMEADRNLIFQAVSNLLDNAGKYGGEGGTIGVTASEANGTVRIAISDTGPGIAPEYRERVKERFFRIPDTAGQPGTGLGLALVAAIVALHKGRMEIGDAGPGTEVVLTF
jgi:signal transduction histidine kinase